LLASGIMPLAIGRNLGRLDNVARRDVEPRRVVMFEFGVTMMWPS
jgi:hypothetical protein